MHHQDVARECGDQEYRRAGGDPAHLSCRRRNPEVPAVADRV
jgi:hypothetical protein